MLGIEKFVWVDIDQSSRLAYKLLSDIKRDIGNIFLHNDNDRKMRKRQYDKAQERIERNGKRLAELIWEARSSHVLKKVVSRVVYFTLVSWWDESPKDAIAAKVDTLPISMNHVDPNGKSEATLISALLELQWMHKKALEYYLLSHRRARQKAAQ